MQIRFKSFSFQSLSKWKKIELTERDIDHGGNGTFKLCWIPLLTFSAEAFVPFVSHPIVQRVIFKTVLEGIQSMHSFSLIIRTNHNYWPTHALPEEQQFLRFVDETFEFGAVWSSLYFAAMLALPMLKICGSPESVVQPRHFYIVFPSEEGLKVAVEVVHLEEIWN